MQDKSWLSIYKNNNYQKAIRIDKVSLLISKNDGNTILIGSCCVPLLNKLIVSGEYREADIIVQNYLSAASKFEELDQCMFMLLAVQLEEIKGNYKTFLKYVHPYVEYALENKDTVHLIYGYAQLCIAYTDLQQYEKALTFINKGIELCNMIGANGGYYGFLCSQKATHFSRKEIMDSALYYIDLAYKEAKQRENEWNLESFTYSKADILVQMKDYKLASILIHPYLNTSEGRKNRSARFYTLAARCYREMGQPHRALFFAKMGLDVGIKEKEFALLLNSYMILSEVYYSLGEFENALQYKMLQYDYRDSIFQKDKIQEIAKLETEFKVKLKDHENLLLKERAEKSEVLNQQYKMESKKNVEIQKRDTSIKQFLLLTIVISLFFFLSIIVVLLIRNRLKKQRLVVKELTIQKQELTQKTLKDQLRYLGEQLVLESKSNLQLKERLETTSSNVEGSEYLKDKIKEDNNWLVFMSDFNKQYNGVIDRLKKNYPQLSGTDIKVVACIKSGVSNKEIERLLAITDNGVKKAKSRVRDKLQLDKVPEIALFIDDFIATNC